MNYSKHSKRTSRLLVALTLVALAVPLIMGGSSKAAPQNASQAQASPQSQDRRPDKKFHKAGKPIRDHYVVVLNPDTPGDEVEAIANDLLARHGGTTTYVYKHALKGFSIQLPEPAAMAMSNDPRVQYVQEDGEATLDTTQTVPNWGLDRIDQRNLPRDNKYHFANINTGAGVHVYVVDSGIQNTHTEFRNANGTTRVVRDYDGVWDFQNGNDCNGHGTFVAGVVGSNTFGVAKGSTLHAIRVFGCGPTTFNSTITAGIDWVTANRQLPAVMNMSFTAGGIDYAMEDAVRNAINSGINCVVSAGNSNMDASSITPQRVAEAITVGATDITDARASFSNFGPFVDVFAPGVDITSTSNTDVNGNGVLDDATEHGNGTSFAAPYVSGIAARFIEAHPGNGVSVIQGAIINGATPDLVANPGPGSPNLLAYSEIHAKEGVAALAGPIKESDTLRDSGIDVGPNQWPAFFGLGEIWSGVPFTFNNGPQGWNSIENSSAFPLPGSRPFSLLGIVDNQTFYIGRSNALRTNFSSFKRLFFRTNDDVPGNGSGEFLCTIAIWNNLPDSSADFVSQTVPTTVLPGQSFPVSITMKNVGATTWTAGEEFKLALQPDSLLWGVVRVTVPNDVAPGSTVTFNFNAIAPTTPGNYGFQWRMIDEGQERFGDVTPNVTITVLSWSNQAQFISQSVPAAMYVGETYNVSVTMKNVGNTTWQTSSNYWLGSQNLQDNMRWGKNRVPLPFAVPPGGQVTIPFTVTAPGTAGKQNFQWRMVQDGVEWFGPQTPNVQVTVKLPPCPSC
jgi:subtilisin family serine protease